MPDKFSFLLLHFFRDFTAAQRLAILVDLDALPQNWTEALTHSMERRAFDSLRTKGAIDTYLDVTIIKSPTDRMISK